MKLKLFLSSVSLLITINVFAQQDAQFSQYMFNGLYINPAYAGYKEQLNLHTFYRSQWTGGLDGNPETFSLALDAIANNGNVGLALTVLKDQLGAESTLAAYANYAYRLKVGSTSRLALGLGVGVAQYGLDGAMLESYNPNDPSKPLDMQSVIVPDIRAGIYYSSDRYYAGFSADNLISRYMNYAKDPTILIPTKMPHFYLTAGTLIPLSKMVLLKPSFMLKNEAKGPANLDLNTFVLLGERLWLGASYRTGINAWKKNNLQENLSTTDAFVALAEIYATDRLRIGYAYDFAFNKFKDFNYGTHEISLGYSFIPKKVRMLSPRYF